jgi:hypothetical protein
MTPDRKKPGVAFWATVVVAAMVVAYPVHRGVPSQKEIIQKRTCYGSNLSVCVRPGATAAVDFQPPPA